MKVGRVAARVAILIVSTAIAVKAADLFVGWYNPAGISHFTHKGLHDRTVLKNEAVLPLWSLSVPVADAEVHAGVDYRINGLGFRGHDYDLEKPDGVFRIVLLGDSVTYGWGVEVEDRFSDLVERTLDRRATDAEAGARRYEILNLAVPGYETTHQLYSWQRLGKTLQADLVVVVFNQNDVQLIPDELLQLAALDAERQNNGGLIRRFGTYALREAPWKDLFRSALPNLRNLAVFHFVFRTTTSDEQALTAQFAEMKDGIRSSIHFLGQLKERVEDTGASFALCDLQHFDAIQEGCDSLAIPYRSIAYDGYLSDMSLRNSPSDPHPNAAGHALLADRFLWALDDMALLPKDAP